ncbi:hypothetical protein [Actinocorallia longicatena]|uniref:Mce-associated membrane protein n=1 Tax=Actinocorallia longicatena TaxID=111803 RepID=A0ABP6QE60_9ACTN
MNLFKKSSVDEIDVEEEAAIIDGQLSLDDAEAVEAEPVEAEAVEAEPVEAEPVKKAEPAKKAKTAEKPAEKAKPAKEKKAGTGRQGPPVWVMVVLGLVAAALVGGSFVLRADSDGKYSEQDLDDATRTAFNSAQDISTWDYRTIEGDTKHVLSETTGEFRTAYQQSAAKLLANAPAQEAVTLGTASKAGVESVGKDGIKVLVFLNQSTTRKGAEPSTDLHRLRLTMVKKDGDWLVSKLEVL